MQKYIYKSRLATHSKGRPKQANSQSFLADTLENSEHSRGLSWEHCCVWEHLMSKASTGTNRTCRACGYSRKQRVSVLLIGERLAGCSAVSHPNSKAFRVSELSSSICARQSKALHTPQWCTGALRCGCRQWDRHGQARQLTALCGWEGHRALQAHPLLSQGS